jgi:hypothetical protein
VATGDASAALPQSIGYVHSNERRRPTRYGFLRPPVDGLLYGIGLNGFVYRIDKATGAATLISAVAMSPTPSGASFATDFNPAVDRIRLMSNTQQNLRVNPTTGAVAANDTALSYAGGDVNAGQTPNVSGAAYTNSLSPAPTLTTLYAIDVQTDSLVSFTNPNTGLLNTVGPLGVNANGAVGFDIYGGIAGDGSIPANNKPMSAYAALSVGAGGPALYTINLTTGAATKVGDIGYGSDLAGLAIEP